MPTEPAGPYDLAVVGTGIIGTMTAYRAVLRHPHWRVLVVGAGAPGSGATGMSAGFDIPSGRDARQFALASRSTSFYRELAAHHPELARRAVDVCWLVDESGQAALARTLHGSPPVPAGEQMEQRLSDVFPGFTKGLGKSLLISEPGAHAEPAQLAAVLLDQVRSLPGNAVWHGFTVRDIRRGGTSLDIRSYDGTSVTVRRAVIATGPWALDGPYGDVARAHGIRLKKVAAFHIPVASPPGAPALVFEDEDAFLLPQPDQRRWLFSFTSADWDCHPHSPKMRLGPHDRELALGILDRHVPGFSPLIAGGQVHCDGYAPDRLPVVVSADGPAVLAVGGAGSGYRLAPAIAEDVLDLLERQECDTP
jgi:glycine/D-amino acid oxidase-like deaminating enzyme